MTGQDYSAALAVGSNTCEWFRVWLFTIADSNALRLSGLGGGGLKSHGSYLPCNAKSPIQVSIHTLTPESMLPGQPIQ